MCRKEESDTHPPSMSSHPLTNPISHKPILEDPRSLRLSFSPTYSLVGIYRLLTDYHLQSAVWAKCKHGTLRGLAVGGFWVFISWRSQLGFVEKFLMGTKQVTRFAGKDTTILGYTIPLALYATFFIVGSQFWYSESGIVSIQNAMDLTIRFFSLFLVLRFFLSKNIRIARARAWSQVNTSS